MRKVLYASVLVASALVFSGCSKQAEVVSTEVKVSDTKVDVEQKAGSDSVEIELGDTQVQIKVDTEEGVDTPEKIEADLQEALDRIDQEQMDWMDENGFGEPDEDYSVHAPIIDEGKVTLTGELSSELYDIEDMLGYSMKTLRPFTNFEQVGGGTYEELLSTDWVPADGRFHMHCSMEEQEAEGYFFDDPKTGPCWIEEELHVSVYTVDTQENHVIYETEDDKFTDLLDDLGTTTKTGSDTRCHKVVYEVGDREWVTYYMECSIDKEPKDNFSEIVAFSYSPEENGDYTVVELYYRDSPTVTVDTHVTPIDERLEGAKTSLETIIQTIHKN